MGRVAERTSLSAYYVCNTHVLRKKGRFGSIFFQNFPKLYFFWLFIKVKKGSQGRLVCSHCNELDMSLNTGDPSSSIAIADVIGKGFFVGSLWQAVCNR